MVRMRPVTGFRLAAVTAVLVTAVVALGVAHAAVAIVDFDADTPGLPPATGGAGQPTGLVIQPGTTVTVQTSANGITTQPVVLGMSSASPYASVDIGFPAVASGVVRVESTVSFDRLAWGSFLQTSVPSAVVSRLLMTDDGRLLSEANPTANRMQVGTYAANTPFRVRMDVDMTARTWSVAIDNELNGFADDPVTGGLSFLNDDSVLPSVSRVHASLSLFPVASVGPTTVAYDDIEVTVLPSSPGVKEDCMDGGWEAFGFRNQGQCIRFINTGVDSR
jgi:hypothetical protein